MTDNSLRVKRRNPGANRPASDGSRRRGSQFSTAIYLATSGPQRRFVRCSKKQLLFSQGDPADSVFYLQRGRVRVTIASTNGKEATIGLLGPGDFAGEECLGSTVRTNAAVAITEVVVLRIEKSEFLRTLRQEPALNELFLKFLLGRVAHLQDNLANQLFNSTEKRLARVLLELATDGKSENGESVISKLSQETLAAMIGTSRARVNFFMTRFRRMGLIQYDRELQVDIPRLGSVLED